MTLQGEIHEGDWTVAVSTAAHPDHTYACKIHVSHRIEGALFQREFLHSKTFRTEREAMLEGLREGMIWIELKRTRAFTV